MRIITLEKREFDNFAQKHKYESYFQTSDNAEFEQTNGYDVHYLGFTDDEDNLIGAAMCLYKNLFWNYNYAYVPRGLLIDYDNPYTVNQIITRLKKLLYKQNFVFARIDPPIVKNEYDYNGKIIYTSDTANQIFNTLKRNSCKHFGFNLYYETKLPRFNLIIKLNKDINTLFNTFSNEAKESIIKAQQNAIFFQTDNEGDIDSFYELIKKSYGRVGKRYFQNIYKKFSQNNKIDINYAILNSQQFVNNANKLYNLEEEKNNSLAGIISGNDSYKYDTKKVISDKMISDKKLHQYKKDIVSSTEFLKKYPNGKIIATSLVIKHQKGADCLIFYEDPDYTSYNGSALLIYEMCKKYGEANLKYLNLGPTSGNFDKKNPFYKKNISKLGFNTTIMEYIGEFDLIINPLMYRIYEYKKNKAKKRKK